MGYYGFYSYVDVFCYVCDEVYEVGGYCVGCVGYIFVFVDDFCEDDKVEVVGWLVDGWGKVNMKNFWVEFYIWFECFFCEVKVGFFVC